MTSRQRLVTRQRRPTCGLHRRAHLLDSLPHTPRAHTPRQRRAPLGPHYAKRATEKASSLGERPLRVPGPGLDQWRSYRRIPRPQSPNSGTSSGRRPRPQRSRSVLCVLTRALSHEGLRHENVKARACKKWHEWWVGVPASKNAMGIASLVMAWYVCDSQNHSDTQIEGRCTVAWFPLLEQHC